MNRNASKIEERKYFERVVNLRNLADGYIPPSAQEIIFPMDVMWMANPFCLT